MKTRMSTIEHDIILFQVLRHLQTLGSPVYVHVWQDVENSDRHLDHLIPAVSAFRPHDNLQRF